MAKKSAKENDASDSEERKEAPVKATSEAATPRAPTKASSSSSLLFVVIPVVLAVVGALYTTYGVPPTALTTTTIATTNSAHNATNQADKPVVPVATDPAFAPVVDKYASEIIQIETQKLLSASPARHACPSFEILGDLTHVEEAMAKGADQLRTDNVVFMMLNGQNEGLYVPWTVKDGCLRELALAAAEKLGADVDVLANGVKLMTQMGHPITSVSQLDIEAGRIAHVLLDFQIWVWPGIKVGHVFEVEGCTVKTLSLRPKVFEVLHFFTDDEAQEIMRQGIDRLERSPVDSPDAVDGYHSDRTSYTAFLRDNAFTRDFRVRTAKLARLPSPSFVERLQLVRYETGQFFRKHEDYFDSKQFVPKKELALEEYKAWTEWASTQIRGLPDDVTLPDEFKEGGSMFPDFESKITFQLALLTAFLEDAAEVDFFQEHADVEWGKWIQDNVANRANDIIDPLLKDKGYMLPHMIKAWEKRAGIAQLKYQIPKRPVSAVSQYFRWIRWLKERVQTLMDEDPTRVPVDMRPTGRAYATYNMKFQNVLVNYLLEDYTQEELVASFGAEWTTWITEHKDSKDVLWQALKSSQRVFDKVVESYTKRAGPDFAYTKPVHLQHFEPNRFVTVFLYLNECPEGGETVFPYSKERLVTGIQREGMAECSEGLAVPPTKLTAAMFYAQTPENFPDPSSLHGGCPPAQGIKYGSNSFAWNADADEGANAWDLGADLKANPSAED